MKLKINILHLICIIGWLFAVEVLFRTIKSDYIEKVSTNIKNQFRSEFNSDSYQKVSNWISEITRTNYITCTILHRLSDDKQNEIEVINFTKIYNCNDTVTDMINLNNQSVKLSMTTLNGSKYMVQFKIPNSPHFLYSLWLTRFIGFITIPLLFWIYYLTNKNHALKIKTALEIANAKELISLRLAHDIRSPLSVLNLLVPKLNFPDNEHQSLFNSAIVKINLIAENLLESNRQKQIINKSIDVVINEIVRGSNIEKNDIDFIIEIDQNVKSNTQFNYIEVTRMLSNIINNSIHALNKNYESKKIINISVSLKSNNLFITIRDNGCGIPVHILKNIGNEPATHGKTNGSGIGLYTAFKYIESISGQIQIKSEVNKYTEVAIKIPLLVYIKQ